MFVQDALSTRRRCESISINNDSVVENTEDFVVTLAAPSSDPAATISADGSVANVNIVDSTSKSEVSNYTFAICYTKFAGIIVSSPVLFFSIFEGRTASVCVIFNNTMLDRDVPIIFTVTPVSAVGRYSKFCLSLCLYCLHDTLFGHNT